MVSVRKPLGRTMPNSTMIAETIATSEDGTSLEYLHGILGTNSIVSIEMSVMVSMQPSSGPDLPRNGCSCASPITMARPLQKPAITLSGIRVMYLAPPTSHSAPISTPAKMTDGKTSSMPSPLPPTVEGGGMNVAMIAANAPVAPLIMPGRPPSAAQMSPTIQAACSATGGRTWAKKANATDSGTWANVMVMPSKTSVLTCATRCALLISAHGSGPRPVFTAAVGADGMHPHLRPVCEAGVHPYSTSWARDTSSTTASIGPT
mmetsp:Transcript_18999/g.48995  ORF Transcript_18999/g.48995 Transcript_18999/m.48995 type:complete len:262 (+) Transcript_18999:1158-1943(+)